MKDDNTAHLTRELSTLKASITKLKSSMKYVTLGLVGSMCLVALGFWYLAVIQ